jgi:hypothetical protein
VLAAAAHTVKTTRMWTKALAAPSTTR